MPKKIANREMFAAYANRTYTTLDLPEYKMTVRIQSITEREKSNFETAILSTNGRGVSRERLRDANRRLCALGMVDEDGARLYSDDEVHLIGDLDARLVSKIAAAVEMHVGMKDGATEDLAKKSDLIHVNNSNSS